MFCLVSPQFLIGWIPRETPGQEVEVQLSHAPCFAVMTQWWWSIKRGLRISRKGASGPGDNPTKFCLGSGDRIPIKKPWTVGSRNQGFARWCHSMVLVWFHFSHLWIYHVATRVVKVHHSTGVCFSSNSDTIVDTKLHLHLPSLHPPLFKVLFSQSLQALLSDQCWAGAC